MTRRQGIGFVISTEFLQAAKVWETLPHPPGDLPWGCLVHSAGSGVAAPDTSLLLPPSSLSIWKAPD